MKKEENKAIYEVVKDGKITKVKKTQTNSVEFTVDELVKGINSYNRECNEIDAELQVRKVLIKNFENANKKFVKYITDENLEMIHEYLVAKIETKYNTERLEQSRKRIVDLEKEMAEIEAQTGLKANIPTIKYEKAKQDGE
jgi:hypothetical protein